ncbi:GumC family protein [Labilibacter marinus]|uniref:GumC family protein n=1 Tax=Labilibacter marinus TaxID=1477105 RepID=UPI00082ED083|nr:polysaccharide biosynthesis tyrosine autokinase [Labilibacter marinus]
MRDVNEIMEYLQEEESVDIKAFLFKMLAKWRWFLLFGIIGSGIGMYLSKSTSPTFEVNSTVLVNEESANMGMSAMFEDVGLGGKSNIENHLLMLQSYTLVREALGNLSLNVSWYKRGLLIDKSLYKNSPYIIQQDESKVNLEGVKINVIPISNKLCTISVKDKVSIKGIVTHIEFEEIIEYGVPYESDFFNFTIISTEEPVKLENKVEEFSIQNLLISRVNVDSYYFCFNDLEGMAKSYQRNTSVALASKKAEGINLTVKDVNPIRGVDFLNELVKVYMDYGLSQKNRTSENTVNFIDAQLIQLVDSLDLAGKNFTEFRSKNGIVNLSQEADLVVEKLEELESQRAAVNQRVDYYRSLQSYMGSAERADLIVAPSVMGITDVALNSQLVRLTELYNRKSNWSFVAKENNPGMLMIDQEINSTLQSLEENLKNLLINSEQELKSFDVRISRINMELAGLPQTEQELINIKRSFDLNNELYTFLLEKRAEAAITTASNVPDAYVLDPARYESAVQVGPKTMINLIIGLIGGLAIPFLFIVIGDYFNETIQSKEEIEKSLKVPFVGEVAHNKYKTELPVYEYPRSGIAENFRGLRIGMQHIYKDFDHRVIAVHSMFPGEGKSFSAVNLAASIASDHKKVLLIGCDLRKPRLHDIFNDRNDKGLSSYLVGEDNFDDIIIQTEFENLCYASSGPIPPNPSALIGNGKMEAFIEKAKQYFDFVVMDNAPVTLVADGILAGKHANVNLFILRQGYSNRNQIKYINNIGADQRVKNVGVVFNDTVYTGYGYSSYGNYNYGYGYYEDDDKKKGLKKRLFNPFSRA